MHLRAIQYNIGKFNYGDSGGLQTNVPTKINNYNTFLTNQNSDVLFMQEFTEYVDANQQYNSDTAIFDGHFSYKSYVEREMSIKSKYAFANSAFSYLHTSGDPPAQCVYGNTTINGQSVLLVTAVLNVTSNIEQKLRALNKLVNIICSGYTNVLVGMDTNALSKSEADSMKSYMADNGFQTGNWNKYGYKETYDLTSSYYHCIDNIFAKGNFEIINFNVPNVYADLSSDHFPVVSDILLYS